MHYTMLIPEIIIQNDSYPITHILGISEVTSKNWNDENPDSKIYQENLEFQEKTKDLHNLSEMFFDLKNIYYNAGSEICKKTQKNIIDLNSINPKYMQDLNKCLTEISDLVRKIDDPKTRRSSYGEKMADYIKEKISLEIYQPEEGNIKKLENFLQHITPENKYWELISSAKSLIRSNKCHLEKIKIIQPHFTCIIHESSQDKTKINQIGNPYIEKNFYFNSEKEANNERDRIIQEIRKIWGKMND